MCQYGGTIGGSQCPFYHLGHDKRNRMLPRPVVSCRPGNYGYRIMNYCGWFQDLVKIVEHLTLQYLIEDTSEISKAVLFATSQCKKYMPSSM